MRRPRRNCSGFTLVDLDGREYLRLTRLDVGGAPVDVMNYEQWAAIANGMNYEPMPVVQGYQAYTPYLQQLNLEHLRSLSKPAFMLYKQETIDVRFPTLDDSAAFNYVLRNYLPIESEGDFMLLRKTDSQDAVMAPVHERVVRFGEPFDISGWANEPLFMSVAMTPTVIGTVTLDASGSGDFADPNAAGFPHRFYRTRDTQP